MSHGADFPYEIMQQAASWYSVLRADNVAPEDLEKWRRWLELRDEHRNAWNLVERVGGRFAQFNGPAEKSGAFKALQPKVGPMLGRRTTLLAMGAVSLAAVFGWRSVQNTVPGDYLATLLADYSTATGETRLVRLAEGSRVWLNTLSAVDINQAASPLSLRLLAGEIQINHPHTSVQTMQVQTSHGQALLHDAQCGIRLFDGSTNVSVQRGTVEVFCGGQRVVLQAGQQMRFSSAGAGPVLPVSAFSQAWVDGLFVAQGIPLGQLISELARYRHGVLGCDPKVADLRVVGTFSIRDTDRALASLVGSLPVKINRLMPWWVTLEARV